MNRYDSKKRPCQVLSESSHIGTILARINFDTSRYGTSNGDEMMLQSYVGSVGPVSVCIYVSDKFLAYKSGNEIFIKKIFLT